MGRLKPAIKEQAASQHKRSTVTSKGAFQIKQPGLQLALACLPEYSGLLPQFSLTWNGRYFVCASLNFFLPRGGGVRGEWEGESESERKRKNVCERQEPQKEHV